MKKKRWRESRKPATILKQLAQTPRTLAARRFRHQYGAICFRFVPETEAVDVLVITSRDTGRWVIPKGWPMKGKKPWQAAAIEALEEAGVRGVVGRKPVGRYTYLKSLDDGEVVPCMVELYQLEATSVELDFKEKGQRRAAWVSTDEAARRVREIELKSLLVNFRPKIKR
ncbi:DNA mismatch repair protein MutT [Metarhizobium album]|uniref:DNA mismatch repair protein MutT n=1 Tax=Metarhizobium album TaxID=2182425 RepID=A0A2U2DI14_9HYPH|nr:NUDIX hydrolase [Rhizobium album]PWE52956.1 DNA mismatch repair protein MutT [Rhizobium album]